MHLSTSYPAAACVSSRWLVPVWALIFILLSGALHLYIPYPLDSDTAYHTAVGHLIREHGILHSFPWTPFSWLSDHYADKELLFHLLFVPFAGLSYTASAAIIGTITCSTALLTIYLILRAEGVRFAGLWSLIPLFASCTFIYRFSLVRPHILSIALAFIVLWSATRGRLIILAAASAIYPWAYVAWHLPFILIMVAEAARLLSSQRIRWQPALVALAGIFTGVMLHPNSLNLASLAWIQIVDVLIRTAWGVKEGFDLGTEFLPESIEGWTMRLGIALLMLIAGLVLSWKNRHNDPVSLTFALTALAFAAITCMSSRFVEYFVPFSAAALALASRSISWRFLPHAIICVSIVYTFIFNASYLSHFGTRPNEMPQSVSSVLQEKIPVGSQVFNPDWVMTGSLMLALPDRRFIVALDPTFFYKKDPELYRLWYKLPREATQGSAEIIRKRFQARYVLCFYPRMEWRTFLNQLSSEPGVKWLLIDDLWILFDLGPL